MDSHGKRTLKLSEKWLQISVPGLTNLRHNNNTTKSDQLAVNSAAVEYENAGSDMFRGRDRGATLCVNSNAGALNGRIK